MNQALEHFTEVVREAELPFVVDFWSPQCGPCRSLMPKLEQLAARYKGRIKFGKVDVSTNGELASELEINAVPTLIVFDEGRMVQRLEGVPDLRSFQAFLDELAPAV